MRSAASKSAGGYKAVGMILSAPDPESLKKELKRAGADKIIENLVKPDFSDMQGYLRVRADDRKGQFFFRASVFKIFNIGGKKRTYSYFLFLVLFKPCVN